MKRVSFPSLIHLLSRHTSKQQFIVQFLSHKSGAVSSMSPAKNPVFQRRREARCDSPSFGGGNERAIQTIADAISARGGTFCLSHWRSRSTNANRRKKNSRPPNFAAAMFSADRRRRSKIAGSVLTISEHKGNSPQPTRFC